MKTTLFSLAVVGLALATPSCTSEANQDPARTATRPTSQPSTRPHEPSEFARFVPLGEDEGKFETAIQTYENAAGQRVSLIASIHIADAKHYRELQQEFERYDKLLYELVGPEDYRPKPGDARGSSILSMIQMLMKNALELEFQLDGIDYTPGNFVHADLTPSGFADAMEERGESILTIILDMINRQNEMIRQQAEDAGEDPPPPFDIVAAFRTGYGRHTLRMTVANMLVEIESLAAGAGPDGKGTVLLEGRNDRALEVLAEQLRTDAKTFGIYYGAAHMPDIEKKMIRDMGFEKVGERWLEAWDIRKRPDKKKRDK